MSLSKDLKEAMELAIEWGCTTQEALAIMYEGSDSDDELN